MIAPKVFVNKSSIDVNLYVNNCIISMVSEKNKPESATFLSVRNAGQMAGSKNPKGIVIIILKNVGMASSMV